MRYSSLENVWVGRQEIGMRVMTRFKDGDSAHATRTHHVPLNFPIAAKDCMIQHDRKCV